MSTQKKPIPATSNEVINENAVQGKVPTYEELKNYAIECSSKLKEVSDKYDALVKEYITVRQSQVFARLEFLFKVINVPSMFPQDFLNQCIEEIQTLLTINEEEQDTTKKTNKN